MNLTRRVSAGLAAFAVAVFLSACNTVGIDGSAPTAAPLPKFSDFNPCANLPSDFVTRRGLEMLGSYESNNVVGDKPGRVCQYLDPFPGYSLLIAATAAELGYPGTLYKELYEPLKIGGRDAERSGPQTGREDKYECRLLVDMAVGGLWFQFIRSDVLPGDPCADLTEIATEVVDLLPPGS